MNKKIDLENIVRGEFADERLSAFSHDIDDTQKEYLTDEISDVIADLKRIIAKNAAIYRNIIDIEPVLFDDVFSLLLDILKTDKFAFLKLQLSWLGKEYVDENWLGYDEKIQMISDTEKYLETICGKYLDKTKQKDLRKTLNLSIANNSSNLPGKTVLNKAMSEYGLDFVIVSKELKRQTCWVVKKK